MIVLNSLSTIIQQKITILIKGLLTMLFHSFSRDHAKSLVLEMQHGNRPFGPPVPRWPSMHIKHWSPVHTSSMSAHLRKHSYTVAAIFRGQVNRQTCMSLGCGSKPEQPEEPHAVKKWDCANCTQAAPEARIAPRSLALRDSSFTSCRTLPPRL